MITKISIDPKIKCKELKDILTLPTVVKVTEFDTKALDKFLIDMQNAANTDQPVIPIIVDSFGGIVYSLLGMIDIINSMKVPVATIGIGKHMSCGAILLSAGTEGYRYMSPLSSLMVHDVSSASWGKVEEIKADAKETDRLNELLYKLLAKNTGKPEKYFWDLVQSRGRADWYLTPEEAKSHNIINHIGIPSFNLSVKTDLTFSL